MTDKLIWTEEELPQRSQSWSEMRKTCLGASDMATILGDFKYEKPETFWKRKTGRLKPKKENAAMLRGAEGEVGAKKAAIEELSKPEYEYRNPPVLEGYFVRHSKYPFLGVSFDGVDLKNAFVVELKNPSTVSMFRSVWEDGIQDYYYPQIQLQMFVAEDAWGFNKGYFASYYEQGAYIVDWREYKEHLKYLCLIDIDYDEEYCLAMVEVAKKFWDMVQYDEWDEEGYRKTVDEFKNRTGRD